MGWTTPKTWITGNVIPKEDLDEQIRDNLNHLKVNISLETAVELTIAAGVVTKTRSHHTITVQSGSTDDLDTINGGAEGEVILIRATDSAKTIIVKTGTGNIVNPAGSDVTLDDANDYCLLVHNGTNWIIQGGSSGDSGMVGTGNWDAGLITDSNNTIIGVDLGGI